MPATKTKRRITKPPTAKQLAARKKFVAMVRAKSKAAKSKKRVTANPKKKRTLLKEIRWKGAKAGTIRKGKKLFAAQVRRDASSRAAIGKPVDFFSEEFSSGSKKKNPVRRRNKTIIKKAKKVIVLNPRRGSRQAKSFTVRAYDSKLETWLRFPGTKAITAAQAIAQVKREESAGYASMSANMKKIATPPSAITNYSATLETRQNPTSKTTRRKYRNGYLDLVIAGTARRGAKGWKIGGKEIPVGTGIVPVKAGHYLDKKTGTVFTRRERNVAQGAFYGGSFHPYRSSDDYDEGRVGHRTRSAKKRASLKKAIRTSTDKTETRKRKSTTSRLASRSLSRSVPLKRASRNPIKAGDAAMYMGNAVAVVKEGLRDKVPVAEIKLALKRFSFSESEIKRAFKIARTVKRNPSPAENRREFVGHYSGNKTLRFPDGTPGGLSKCGTLKLIKLASGQKFKPGIGAAWLCRDQKGKLHLGTTRLDGVIYNGPAQNWGEIDEIEYNERKENLYPGKGVIRFYHKHGEENGIKPSLISDGKGGLKFKGGAYKIESRGIVN